MSTPRERLVSFLLILFIGLVVTGFLAYKFILEPINEADAAIAEADAKIEELEKRETKLLFDQKHYEIERKMSLPADVVFARREYTNQLESLLRKSDFAANAVRVSPRKVDNKTVPSLAGKKPAWNLLSFDVIVTGDLASLTNFLELFYRQPLLHQIKSLTVQRPTGNNERRRNANDMEIAIVIEALVLDKAENRATLDPVPTGVNVLGGGGGTFAVGQMAMTSGRGAPYHLDPVLASANRLYAAVTGKNIFFGPAPPRPIALVNEDTPKEPDISGFVKLVGIAGDDGKLTATFYDMYNNQDYKIIQNPDGSYKFESFEYANRSKIRILPRPKTFEFGTAEKGNLRQFKVVKVADGEVYIQPLNEEVDQKFKTGGSLLGGGVFPQIAPMKTMMVPVGGTVKDAQEVKAGLISLGNSAVPTSLPTPPKRRPEL